MEFFNNKHVLVTGSSGTIGSHLVETLRTFGNIRITAVDNNESGIFSQMQRYKTLDNVGVYYCDIRNYDELLSRVDNVDVLLHCAAMKHVEVSELAPNEAVLTNILGVQNVIKAAVEKNVEHTLFTSSDKAVNPTNVMGTTKLLGERLISAAGNSYWNRGLKFGSTRFGNVLGSSGSVMPIFVAQAKKGTDLTLTDEQMTRFVMSKGEAINLVLETVPLITCGEVFVTKMKSVFIKDLAICAINQFGTKKQSLSIIGSKAGEKLYEELLSDEECLRSFDLGKYICIVPTTRKQFFASEIAAEELRVYNSNVEDKLSLSAVENYLKQNSFFIDD